MEPGRIVYGVCSKSVKPKLNYGKNRRHGSRQLLQMYYSYDDSERKREMEALKMLLEMHGREPCDEPYKPCPDYSPGYDPGINPV